MIQWKIIPFFHGIFMDINHDNLHDLIGSFVKEIIPSWIPTDHPVVKMLPPDSPCIFFYHWDIYR